MTEQYQTQQISAAERVQLLKASSLWQSICVALARAFIADFKETEYGYFCVRLPIISKSSSSFTERENWKTTA